jgi:hypothetical protein
MAKEPNSSLKNDNGTYNLTKMTGSRYTAPEVANGMPYNHSCDVYSFTILLWEILALELPFEMHGNPKCTKENVYNGTHKRPKIDDSWPESIQLCMNQCWSKNIDERFEMSRVVKILREELRSIRSNDRKQKRGTL